jgi:HK97 family phage major capsid protein
MPTALQDLVDRRAAAFAQAEEFATRRLAGEELAAEDQAAWERALNDVDAMGAEVENLERTARLSTSFAEIDERARAEGAGAAAGTPAVSGDYERAFEAYVRHGMARLSGEQQELLHRGFAEFDDPQARALSASIGTAGGYTVPEGFWAKVTETMKAYGGAWNGAELITTTTGAALPWPTNDDTGNEGYILGENVEATNEGDMEFGKKTLEAFTFVSGPAKVSLILMQDSGVDIEGLVARKMGERIGRRKNRAFTTGTGSSQPQGYVTGLTVGKTTASATAVTYNEVIDLEHSVDAAYRASGRCRYKFHDLVFAELRKLRDDSGGAGVGRPLWQPTVSAGAPDTFNNHPYDINNDMDSTVAATKKTMAFGDFQSAFVVRVVVGGQLMRLTERYAENLQVGFIAFERADSIVQDTSAAKVLQQHA